MTQWIRMTSPVGELTLTAEGDRLTGVILRGQRGEERLLPREGREEETPVLARARRWLERYFAGERPHPRELPLAPRGTAFQRRVWRELETLSPGETVTYGELARRVGSSPRAVGRAVGANPLSIIVPCHRVVGAGGRLTGYAGGLERKQFLLELEGAQP